MGWGQSCKRWSVPTWFRDMATLWSAFMPGPPCQGALRLQPCLLEQGDIYVGLVICSSKDAQHWDDSTPGLGFMHGLPEHRLARVPEFASASRRGELWGHLKPQPAGNTMRPAIQRLRVRFQGARLRGC